MGIHNGQSFLHVVYHVVVECNKEQENVPILHHQMAAKTATCLEQHLSQETAVLTLAQVRVCPLVKV